MARDNILVEFASWVGSYKERHNQAADPSFNAHKALAELVVSQEYTSSISRGVLIYSIPSYALHAGQMIQVSQIYRT